MSLSLSRLRRSRALTAGVASAATAAVMAVVFTTTSATGVTSAQVVPPPPANPTNADQIQNIDQVRTAIKGYYGDTTTTVMDPVNGTTALHEPSHTSAWHNQVAGIEKQAEAYLKTTIKNWKSDSTPAIVLDVDDTSLVTYDYEIYSNFAYNPTTNADFVNAEVFPKVDGMPALEKAAIKDGYTVFWLTGRPGTQQTPTLGNLTNAGYHDVDAEHLYLKDYTADTWLSSCQPNCSTIQYKTLTRQHINSQGYQIAANFGDQFSDLIGGASMRNFKLPNPMYYLP